MNSKEIIIIYFEPYGSKTRGSFVIEEINSIDNIIAKNEIVYHFAGIAGIKDASDNPIETVKNNIIEFLMILGPHP